MLTKEQIRLLTILDDQITDCNFCELWTGGYSKPSWSPHTRYVMVGEAPGQEEVNKMPFIGKAGRVLWKIANKIGFQREDFLIINSVNCRPIDSTGRNGKPSSKQIDECDDWVRKYIRVVQPKKMILLGNFAIGKFFPQYKSGITKRNGTKELLEYHDIRIPTILSVHPAYSIYNSIRGEAMLKTSLEELKNV